eukprot:TRINITY_DN12392_c0_g1_i1.p1 TRINITY_DN12392_c0_g1~~TRINITY_DN12392_c0_g1_i1.p1  ORF type:complete len:451 (-),score=52.20 TRINITY_DN12392_c0_g1_i1:26-1378(-)
MLASALSVHISSRKLERSKLKLKNQKLSVRELFSSRFVGAEELRRCREASTVTILLSAPATSIAFQSGFLGIKCQKNKIQKRYFSRSASLLEDTKSKKHDSETTPAKPSDEEIESPAPLDLNAPQPTPPPAMPLWKKYLSLSKARLASLVVVSTMAGYLIAPGPIDMWDFAISTVGTTLAIASANSINQYIEVDNDLMMKRTRNRMLPSGAMSLNHALAFGVITGVTGSAILAFGINMLASGLAFANIILYTLVYTPLKRVTPVNTWIGAIVGAIPPLIGWVSKTGGLEAGAWVLFAALALWQIPHFLALSWPLRYDYRNAGYKMLSVTSPDQVAIQTLVYSVMMLGLGPAAWYYGMTSWPFIVDSSLLSLWLVYESWKFYQDNSNTSARRTFKVTLYWLPLFIILMMVHLLHWDSDPEEEVEAAAVSEDILLKAPVPALEEENVNTKQK